MGVPKPLREQVWLRTCGEVYNRKCAVTWCTNTMTPFNFEAGHIIPESKGGETHIDNLLPICAQCNKSMGNRFTIHEFSRKYAPKNQFESFRFIHTVSKHHKSSDNDLQM
jgi:5-methylcytosine-specific restriction endonuclease McrA